MKKSEFFKSLFPLEDLLTKPKEIDVQDIVNYCDYTIEANKVAKADDLPTVNTADAAVFYEMGYEAAMREIEKILVPIEIKL